VKKLIIGLLLSTFINIIYANCNLNQFRWECDIPMHLKPSMNAHSLIYCGDTFGYINQMQFDILARYQRANVAMNVTVNGEYVDGPCIPGER